MSAPLETAALGRRYGRLVALADLSLAVAAGECVALIGANGSGKSTAVRTIAGLLEPSEGTVRVCGVDPHREPDAEQARAALALVPDTPLLYDDLTVRQHLELVTLSHGVVDDDVDDRIGSLLERLSLTARAEFLPRELSRGMRQKTLLACALIRPASVPVLDEPVVGLDPPSQSLLHELLSERRRGGAAVLFTTHQMTFGDGLADRAVRARGGRGRRRGPWGARARASGGGRTGLAVATARGGGQRRLAAVRGWWRVQHPAPSVRQRLDVVYTIAITAAIVGALAYGTAVSALAQVVTPDRLAVLGPALLLLALVPAMRWGAYHGPVVFTMADVAFLLGAPLPRRGLAARRLVLALAGGAATGAAVAGVAILGLAGEGRGIAVDRAAGLVVGLAELGVLAVAGAWAVRALGALGPRGVAGRWPAVLAAAGVAAVADAGLLGRTIALWSGPWGWAVQSGAGAGGAWPVALLLLTLVTAVVVGVAVRGCGARNSSSPVASTYLLSAYEMSASMWYCAVPAA